MDLRPRAASIKIDGAIRILLKRLWMISFSVVIALVMVTAILPMRLERAAAQGAIAGKPTFINGNTGNGQVNLVWGAAANANSYFIEQADLASGQTQRLPTIVSGTSFSPGSLLQGHWYRFRVIPVNDAGEGPPSNAIEIRTRGFAGSYDHYYALGDSYSAGDGAPPYFGAKDCYRSTNSYPYHLGKGAPSPVLIACAGASTDNIDRSVQHPWLPGTQLGEMQGHPRGNSLITITIGGNDVGFAPEFTSCILSFRSCTSHRDAIAQRITALKPRLTQLYREIRQAAPGADIMAIGYPLLVVAPENKHCHNPALRVGLSSNEMRMIRDLAGMLDDIIAQSSAEAGIISATREVQQAFAGHEACTKQESNEWINEIAGLKDKLADSLHPNSAGYLAFAMAINNRRDNLYSSGMVRHA